MPLISIIIPVFNGAKTIRETIESVQNQTLSDLEIIVVDDGSQDDTLAVLGAIADPRLKVIPGAHAGANAARNRGLRESSGEYVSFLDADDLWTPDKLKAQLQALRSHPKAAVAYSWTDRIDEQGDYLRRGGYLSVNGNVLAELLITNFVENGSNPLILRRAAIEVGGFDESLTACQDWDMWLRLAARYEFAAISEVQILYRLSTNSISANVFALEACCRKVIDRAFAQAPQSLQYLKKYSLGNVYKYLTFKAFECELDRKKSMAAAWFLLNVVIHDRTMITDPIARRVVNNAIRKIAVTMLPSKLATVLLNRYKEETDLNRILCHFCIDFAEILQQQPDQTEVTLMAR